MDLAINRDQRGPEGPAMAEINARALMFNLGREDAIDSTTSAKIARYAERKQLAYKLTDEGVLLLDGRGKKIHLRNGVVTLRNALGLHALPERCRAIGDNRVLWCVRYLMGNSYFRPAQSSKPFDTSAHWFEPVGNWENILYAEFASSCDLHLHGTRYSAIMYQKRFFNLLTRGQCMFMHCYFVSGPTEN